MGYRPNIKQQKGLSLIEMIVAITILTVAFVGMVQAFPFGLSINKEAADSTVASYLCQGKLEEVVSLGYDNITVGTIEARHRLSNDPANYLYFYERETTIAYIDGNLNEVGSDQGMKKISSTVYYINAVYKNENSHNITTLISQR